MVKILNCNLFAKKSYDTLSKSAIFFGQLCTSATLSLPLHVVTREGKQYGTQRWARAVSKVAPLPLPLLALKSSVAIATRYSSSKVARYRYFTTKVAALPATATRYFKQRVNFFSQLLMNNRVYNGIIKKIN